MFRKIDDFLAAYEHESQATQKILDALTDESLSRRVADGHRTLGNIAWHIVATYSEMLPRTGLGVAGAAHEAPTPTSAKVIADGYRQASASLVAAIKEQWDDAALEIEDDMYGERWKRGGTLAGLISHEAHHRGQLTVLMRQAGLAVPGAYGPSKEEWAKYGMEAPAE